MIYAGMFTALLSSILLVVAFIVLLKMPEVSGRPWLFVVIGTNLLLYALVLLGSRDALTTFLIRYGSVLMTFSWVVTWSALIMYVRDRHKRAEPDQ